jgi:segregation and condensation protein A
MPRITIKERIKNILEILRVTPNTTFKSTLKNASRVEVVVTFLAMLELIKRRIVEANQAGLFEDINIQTLGQIQEQDQIEVEFTE